MKETDGLKEKYKQFDKLLSGGKTLSQSDRKELKKFMQTCCEEVEQSKLQKEGNAISDKLFRLIFEHSPVGIVQFNDEGVVTECNDSFVDILGSTREALIGLDMKELPDQRIVDLIKKSLKGEEATFEGVYTAVTSGKSVPVRVFNAQIPERDDEDLSGGMLIVEDITESYNARKKLEESETKYRNIFENEHSVMLIIDPNDGSILKANKVAEEFYGWSREELTEMNISDINTLPKSKIKKDMDRARTAQQNVFLFKHRLANGSVRHVDVCSSKTVIDGKEVLLSIIHDVSDKVKARLERKKFEMGIERSPNPIFITDTMGNIEYVNPAFEEVYGYTEDEVLHKNPRILKSGLEDESFYENFWNTILSGNVAKGELVNRTKSGEFIHISYSSNPIIDDEGELLGFIAIQDDITDRVQMQEKIHKELHDKEVLLAEIHHRVKNNLATISSMIFLQSVNETNEQLANKLNDCGLRIKAIANIHEQLYKSNSFTEVDFSDTLYTMTREVLDTMNSAQNITVKNQSKKVNLSIGQALNSSIIINEVVTNIIKHAFKDRSGGEIGLKVSEKDRNITIKVEDDGHPFPEDFSEEKDGKLGFMLIQIMADKMDATYKRSIIEDKNEFQLSFRKIDPESELTSSKISHIAG